MEQKDIDFIKSLKLKMHIQQHDIAELWEVYLSAFGKYPRFEKRNACSRCVMDVLNELHAKVLNLPAPDIEAEFKDLPFKPAELPQGKRIPKRDKKENE